MLRSWREDPRCDTRKSAGVWQARAIQQAILGLFPHFVVELVPMKTSGDQFLSEPLYKIGGKGLFLKELEESLLDDRAEICCALDERRSCASSRGTSDHRCLSTSKPLRRVGWKGLQSWRDLEEGAHVGTSSLRRKVQLLRLRPDLKISPLRGNFQKD